LKKNTSEQLRLRTAVEFDGERKRVFCPQLLLVSLTQGGSLASKPKLFKQSPLPVCGRGGLCIIV